MQELPDRYELESLAYRCQYSATQFAESFGMNSRTFRYMFEKVIGLPPKPWLLECRARYAINMLKGGFTTKFIAAYLFYSNSGHLRNEIKTLTGVTPKKIQENFKIDSIHRMTMEAPVSEPNSSLPFYDPTLYTSFLKETLNSKDANPLHNYLRK